MCIRPVLRPTRRTRDCLIEVQIEGRWQTLDRWGCEVAALQEFRYHRENREELADSIDQEPSYLRALRIRRCSDAKVIKHYDFPLIADVVRGEPRPARPLTETEARIGTPSVERLLAVCSKTLKPLQTRKAQRLRGAVIEMLAQTRRINHARLY